MSNLLSGLGYDKSIANEKDVLGGGFTPLDSGIYQGVIKHAYLQKSRSGALAVNIEVDIDGHKHTEALYVTNRNGENFYKDKQGEKHYLPNYLNADAICLFTAKKPLAEQEVDKRVIKLYNFEQKVEVPTEVDMLVDLINQEIKLGIIKESKFKQAKNDDGVYEDTDEITEINTINKVFRASDNKTTAEVRAGVEDASFHDEWLAKWEGKVRDLTKGKAKPQSNMASTAKKTSSLFA